MPKINGKMAATNSYNWRSRLMTKYQKFKGQGHKTAQYQDRKLF